MISLHNVLSCYVIVTKRFVFPC